MYVFVRSYRILSFVCVARTHAQSHKYISYLTRRYIGCTLSRSCTLCLVLASWGLRKVTHGVTAACSADCTALTGQHTHTHTHTHILQFPAAHSVTSLITSRSLRSEAGMPNLKTTYVCPSVTQCQRIYRKFFVGVLYNKLLNVVRFMTICAGGGRTFVMNVEKITLWAVI